MLPERASSLTNEGIARIAHFHYVVIGPIPHYLFENFLLALPHFKVELADVDAPVVGYFLPDIAHAVGTIDAKRSGDVDVLIIVHAGPLELSFFHVYMDSIPRMCPVNFSTISRPDGKPRNITSSSVTFPSLNFPSTTAGTPVTLYFAARSPCS
jgi:hypothetical protein